MRVINSELLRTLGVAWNAAYQGGLGMAPPDFEQIATTVTSTTGSNEYGWLGQFPGVREWLGDRVINAMAAHGYTIKNRDFEDTVAVDRNDIEDDNIGIYTPMFTELGRASAAFPNQLVYALLAAGFLTPCFDGQYFFDTDHPVIQADGSIGSVANTDGGAGTPWFLLDTSRALKPLILQKRKDWQFIAKDKPTDDNVFWQKKFVYGVDARMNVGYGFWQMAWGSRQTLDAAHYETARAALASMKGDQGRPLGLAGKLLVVPPSLEGAARRILKADKDAYGADNVWVGTADLLVTPWLA